MESPAATDDANRRLALAARARATGDERECHAQLQACLALDPNFPFAVLPGDPAPAPSTAGATCLIVHTDARVSAGIAEALSDAGYEVTCAAGLEDAEARLTTQSVDAVLAEPGLAMATISAARARNPRAAGIVMVSVIGGEMDRDPALAPLLDERVDRPATRARWVDSVHAAIWRRRHAARTPVAPAPVSLGSAHARALQLVAAGFLSMAFAASAVQEMAPPQMAAPVWAERTAPQAPWSVSYRSAADMAARVFSEPMRAFGDPSLMTFEVRVRGGAREASEVAASLRLIAGERETTPTRLWVEAPGDSAVGYVVLFAGFPRAAVADAERLNLRATVDAVERAAYLERFTESQP